jgi:hypothetical protein
MKELKKDLKRDFEYLHKIIDDGFSEGLMKWIESE